MRELTKSQIYEMLDMMQQAMDYRGSPEEMMNLLIDCQDAAVKMGEIIEQEVTSEHIAIHFLEAYVECIYQAGSNLNDAKKYQSYLKQAKKYLVEIKNQVRDKLMKTFEILFLPYKASMWDCFDSIYRAILEEGKHCPVVMPIPYYSFDSQQKVIDCIYEGDDLPEDITIMDYQAYDLAERKPDVIFIHNPYDEYNRVTQVPKQFFSSELIKVTKHLVYIPYLIRSSTKIGEHYVLMPGVVNAWRTYVQSDDIRKRYLEYYPFGDKIVAMGSPKIDMVLRINAQEKNIPEEWSAKLTGRKVFLYNTHLHNIMNHADTLFEEYDYVLREFVGREDVALLWRPHPLSLETIKTFVPWIYAAYMEYLAKAEQQNNVVIDKSADLYRAIALSDAYVGDQSSLVELFGVTGKPLFITGEKKFSEEQLLVRAFTRFAVDGSDLWFPDIIALGLFKIDMVTWTARYISRFPTEDLIDHRDVVFKGILKIYNKVILIASPYLFIYDVITKRMKRIDLRPIAKQRLLKIDYMFCYQDEAWLPPVYYGQPLLIYNCQDDSVRVDKRYDTVKVLCGKRNAQEEVFAKVVKEKNHVWVAIHKEKKIVRLNLDDGEAICHELSTEVSGGFAYFKDKLWLLNDTRNALIQYDLITYREECFYFGQGTDSQFKAPYVNVIPDEEYIYILPVHASTIVIFNKKLLTFCYIKIRQEYLNPHMYKPNQSRHFISALPYPGGILLFPITHKGILRLEHKNGKWNSELQLIETGHDSLEHWLWDNKAQLYYSESYPLQLFISRFGQLAIPSVSQDDTDAEDNIIAQGKSEFAHYLASMDGRCGERIWQDIKKYF